MLLYKFKKKQIKTNKLIHKFNLLKIITFKCLIEQINLKL